MALGSWRIEQKYWMHISLNSNFELSITLQSMLFWVFISRYNPKRFIQWMSEEHLLRCAMMQESTWSRCGARVHLVEWMKRIISSYLRRRGWWSRPAASAWKPGFPTLCHCKMMLKINLSMWDTCEGRAEAEVSYCEMIIEGGERQRRAQQGTSHSSGLSATMGGLT